MKTQAQVAPIALTISDISVRQDSEGRYCLNDLHKAAGSQKNHQPSNWLRTQQTQDLIAEIPHIRGIDQKKGVGTFAVKELAISYAMWISASFSLKVIRAYDALQAQPKAPPSTSSIETYQVKILTVFTRGDEPVQYIIPYNSCVVNGTDPVAVRTFISEYVSSTPEMLSALSSAYIEKLMKCQDAAIKQIQSPSK